MRISDWSSDVCSSDLVRAALVSHLVDCPLPQVLVADTQRALASLAAAMQHARAARVVAITGSNGKTSVKALVLSILQRAGSAYGTPGNRNNELGLPLRSEKRSVGKEWVRPCGF